MLETTSDLTAFSIRKKIAELLQLSLPIVVSRVGFLLFSLTDTIIVGQYLTEELAAISITYAIANTHMLIAAGMLLGVLIIASISMGQKDHRSAGLAAKRGIRYALMLSIGSIVLSLITLPLLSVFNVNEDLKALIYQLMVIVVIGLPPILIYVAYSFFLEGISKPLPATVVILVGNVVNFAITYALVFGEFGLPEMGAVGAVWATVGIRFLMAFALIYYVHRMFAERELYDMNSPTRWAWSEWSGLRQIGFGGGLSFGVEAGAFMFLAVMAGALSPAAAAACAILVNIRSILFMVPMGVGFATSVHVGMGHGQSDLREIRQSTIVGAGMGVVFMVIIGFVLIIFPEQASRIYTNDEAVIALTILAMTLLALSMPADALQGVLSNALRGREDILMPTAIHIVAFIVIMIPLSWWLAFSVGLGLTGLIQGLLIGNIIAATLLSLRFFVLNRKLVGAKS